MDPYTKLPRVPLLYSRQNLILTRCQGKRVLHLGCVDAGLLEERFARGELFHQKLHHVASELWGVDIDGSGITFLRDHGFANLVMADVCRIDDLSQIPRGVFDILVAGEVVEHLDNPGVFLDNLKTFMTHDHTELIITVPNAFRIDSLLWLLRGVEYVHPDHNFWFSYVTATNLLRKRGFMLTELYVYVLGQVGILPRARRQHASDIGQSTELNVGVHDHSTMSLSKRIPVYLLSVPRRLLASFLYNRTPFWGDGLILVSKLTTH